MRSFLSYRAHFIGFAAAVFALTSVAHAQQPAPQPSAAPQPAPPPGYVPAAPPPGYQPAAPPPGYQPATPPPGYQPAGPPGTYPPPVVYYPAPPGTAPGAPPPPATPPPPSIIAYEDGDPIPEGYRLDSRARMNLVGTGIGLFIPFYVISTLSAAIAEAGGNSNYWPMYVPTIGPLITISTAKPDNNFEVFMLGLDAVAQTAGIGLIIWGMASREKRLIRVAGETPSLTIAPAYLGRGSFGLGISGTM